MAGVAAAGYDLNRRRFLKDFPDEVAQEIGPLGGEWLKDLCDLAAQSRKASAKTEEEIRL